MDTRAGFAGTVGNTPLIRLDSFSRDTGCEILGKAEFMNPGGSVKDRAALGILLAAEREGRLKPGGTIVEGTAGNTGIGFLHLANERGYRCVIVMPDNQAPEKAALLRVLGAEVRIVKTVPYSDPNHYQKVAGRLADELPDAIWGNQFDNTANRDAHLATTGPEIWRQTDGRIDAFVCATGTGGTLGGVSRALKAADPRVRCVLADPMGSALYQWVRSGELRSEGSSSVTEGIGIGRVTANLEGLADRRCRAGRGSGCRRHRVPAAAPRGALPRRHERSQRRRRRPGRTSARPRPRDRDDPLRRRRAVPVASLRPRVARREGSRGRGSGAVAAAPGAVLQSSVLAWIARYGGCHVPENW